MPPQSNLLYQGAEAVISLNNNLIIKNRIKKSYRIKELDDKIRKQRTKAEKKLLEKACKIINAPNPLPLKEFNVIEMPYIEGKKLSEHLDFFPLNKQKEIMKIIGQETAKLHDNDIIHGDLTTSNMIFIEDNMSATQINKNFNDENSRTNKKGGLLINNLENGSEQSELLGGNKQALASSNFKIYFIDFGLGFISKKIEDKAVDIHLLKQALEAKHFTHWETLFNEFLKGYKHSKEADKVLERLKQVERRGRYKG